MSRKYFGTDGVRGPYGGALVNEDFFARLTMAAVAWSARQAGSVANRRVLVGRDTRASGASLSQAVLNAIAAACGEAVSLGVLPTPAVARAVKITGAALGVVITASHNPAADNGIKFFGPGGQKLTDAEEEAIESLLSADGPVNQPAVVTETNMVDDYIRAAAQLLPAGALAGWKIVIDTANGATCATSPEVLWRLGAEVVGIGLNPDGTNINAGVGSEHPEKLAAKVTASGARLGIAHDGDGDRCILCDEEGAVLDGDEILTMLAVDALQRGALAQHTLVVTVQSNLGVDAAVKAAGGRVFRTNVGDRYVIERMRSEGALLGGESSGHIVCADVSPTGDGLIAALRVLAVMLRTGEPLSVLRRGLRKFPQVTQALKVREKRDLALCPSLTAAIQELEARLGEACRVLVRYSGTEDKLRLLVEAASDAEAAQGLAALEAAAKHDLALL